MTTTTSRYRTPHTDMERVICMACAYPDFLDALCGHPDMVDHLEATGMKFSWVEKTMLKSIQVDQITPYHDAFMSMESELWRHYEAMARQTLNQRDYKIPALENHRSLRTG